MTNIDMKNLDPKTEQALQDEIKVLQALRRLADREYAGSRMVK